MGITTRNHVFEILWFLFSRTVFIYIVTLSRKLDIHCQMIGLLLFDNHDDLLYVFSDQEFRKKIETVARNLEIINCNSYQDQTKPNKTTEIESIVLMQIFSPLLTSYR